MKTKVTMQFEGSDSDVFADRFMQWLKTEEISDSMLDALAFDMDDDDWSLLLFDKVGFFRKGEYDATD